MPGPGPPGIGRDRGRVQVSTETHLVAPTNCARDMLAVMPLAIPGGSLPVAPRAQSSPMWLGRCPCFVTLTGVEAPLQAPFGRRVLALYGAHQHPSRRYR